MIFTRGAAPHRQNVSDDVNNDDDPDMELDVCRHPASSPQYHLHRVHSPTPAVSQRHLSASSRTDRPLTTHNIVMLV